MVTLNVNGVRREVQAPDNTPLLYVLRNDLQLIGPQFGCGLAQCGACSVLVGGKEVRSCVTPVASASARKSPRSKVFLRAGPSKRASGGGSEEYASPGAASLDRGADSAMRLLPERDDDQGNRTAGEQSQAVAGANQGSLHYIRPVAESVPLRNLRRDHGSRTTRRYDYGEGEVSDGYLERETRERVGTDSFATPVREGGRRARCGVQLMGPEILKGETAKTAALRNTLDPTLPSSWIEIHPDNTVLIRTGKSDFGQGSTFTAYRQIVAEELSVPFEAITTVVSGDTDLTPDGSGAFDFLGHGTPNIRKAAAYTHQALLDLASEKLGVPKDKLSVKDGVVSGGGKSVSYGDLVKNEQLKLTIPVKGDLTSIFGLTIEGDPPMKPVSEYTVIGKSFKNSIISSKVAAKETWATDVRLPGMLHARVVHPKTLGSTLVSAGQLDKGKFPNTQVIVKGNLVGVVAPTEWEAIQAAEQVASATKWSEWKGLPGNAKLYQHLRKSRIGPLRRWRRVKSRRATRDLRSHRLTRNFPPRISCLT